MSRTLPLLEVCGLECPYYSVSEDNTGSVCRKTCESIVFLENQKFPNFCPLPKSDRIRVSREEVSDTLISAYLSKSDVDHVVEWLKTRLRISMVEDDVEDTMD